MAPKKRIPVVFTAVLQLTDDFGSRRRPNECVLARELKEKYGPDGANVVTNVNVNRKTVAMTLRATGDRLRWKHSDEVADWLTEFDNGEEPGQLPVVLRVKDAKVTPQKEQAKLNLRAREYTEESAKKRGMTPSEYRLYRARKGGVRTR